MRRDEDGEEVMDECSWESELVKWYAADITPEEMSRFTVVEVAFSSTRAGAPTAAEAWSASWWQASKERDIRTALAIQS